MRSFEMTTVNPADQLTYENFMALCPRKCLRCHREGVIFEHGVYLKWWRPSFGKTMRCETVAVCGHKKCGAVFAQHPAGWIIDEEHEFRHGDIVVTFVDSLPYSISLGGGRASHSLSALPHSLVQKAQSNPDAKVEAV